MINGIPAMNDLVWFINHRVFRSIFWSVVTLSVAVPLAAIAASPWYQLSINRSDSLPGKIYLIDVGVPPACGDIFAVDIQEGAPHYAGKRLLKIALGCAGSVVTVGDRRISVDGREIGFAKRYSNSGDPLEAGQGGAEQLRYAPRDRRGRVDPLDRPGREPLQARQQQRVMRAG